MSKHKWRQGYGIDPMREWIRRELPGSRKGMVVIDLDMAVRRYGPNYGLDSTGDLMLVEKKEYSGQLTGGERYVYGWISKAIENGDYGDRWRGTRLLRVMYTKKIPVCDECGQPKMSDDEAYDLFATAKIEWNNESIGHDQLKLFLEGGE